jgi:two-component system cell cycle sensor histidine kinase/response regulator CckA
MEASRIGRVGTAALWSALVVFSFALITEIVTEARLTAARLQSLQTHRALDDVQEMRTTLTECVAARRAQALHATEATRARLQTTLRRVEIEQSRLRALAPAALNGAELETLRPAIAVLIDAARSSLSGVFDVATDAEAQRESEEDRAYALVVAALERARDEQLALLNRYMANTREISRNARLAEGLGIVISIAVLLFVFRELRQEIARRERSESALRESELSLATTLDSIADAVIVTDVEGRVTRMNPVAEQFGGVSLDQARARTFADVFPLIDARSGELLPDLVRRVLQERERFVEIGQQAVLKVGGGEPRSVAEGAAPIRDQSGTVTGSVIILRDISAQRAAEQRLQEATTFLDSIVENLPNMVFVKEPKELRFVRINRAGEELLATTREKLLGKNDFAFFPPEQAEFFQQKDRDVLKQRSLVDIGAEPIATPSGERWLHTKKIPILDQAGEPLYLLGISEDITEKRATAEALLRANAELERRVEQRTQDLRTANEELKRENRERQQAESALQKSEQLLRQSQKMEAIGRLAGGVAHDFNNMLTVILSYGELVQRSLPAESPLRSDVEQITRASRRASDLTRQLLAFSRQQVLAPKIVDLNASLESMHRMLQRVIGEDIELRKLPGRDLARVRVDPGQIEQVIMNLAVNARDAMPAGGVLTIETANVQFGRVGSPEQPGLAPGPYVLLAVTDTGAGMSHEIQTHIFEPFFTTKEQGKGTGLGLATVFGIVQQSGGNILVQSEPQRGTTFKIYLPCDKSGFDPHSSSHAVRAVGVGGRETVLLVEDDEQVRVLAQTVLERYGFRVIAAAGCEEALAAEAAFKEPIQLLLTDVVMPHMSGRQLAERLSAQRPRMKVLFMSGYTDDKVIHHGVIEDGVQFLQKPLTPDRLTRKVREVLDEV